MSDIKPYTINVPQEQLDLVKKKLELASFPDGEKRICFVHKYSQFFSKFNQ